MGSNDKSLSVSCANASGRFWLVTVDGYGQSEIFARSRGKALADAWRCDAFSHVTFKQFLSMAKATTGSQHGDSLFEGDGYAYVRRAYPDSYNPKLGERINAEGTIGTVVAPEGGHACYVHFVSDASNSVRVCHPMGVTTLSGLSEATATQPVTATTTNERQTP